MQGHPPKHDLEAALIELQLQQFLPRLLQLGVSSLGDVAHLLLADFEEVGLTRLQTRKLQQAALAAAAGANGSAGGERCTALATTTTPQAAVLGTPQQPVSVAIPASTPEPRPSIVRSTTGPTQPSSPPTHHQQQQQPQQPSQPPQLTPQVIAPAGDEVRKVVAAVPKGQPGMHKATAPTLRSPASTPQVPHLSSAPKAAAVVASPATVERCSRTVRGAGPVPSVPELAFPPADPVLDAALDAANAERGTDTARRSADLPGRTSLIRRDPVDDDSLFFDAAEDLDSGRPAFVQQQSPPEPQAFLVRMACPARGGPSAAASTAAPSSSDASARGGNARPSLGQPATSNESESGSDIYEEVDLCSDDAGQTSFDSKDPRHYFRLDIGPSTIEESLQSPVQGIGQGMPVALRRRLEHRNEQRRRGQHQPASKAAPMSARNSTSQQQQQNSQSPPPADCSNNGTSSASTGGVRLRPGEEEPAVTSPPGQAWMNFERLNMELTTPKSAEKHTPGSGGKVAQQGVKSPRKGHGGPGGKQQRSRPAPEGVRPLNLPTRGGTATPSNDVHRTSSAGAKASGTTNGVAGDRTPPNTGARMTRSDSGTNLTLAGTRPRSETPRVGTTGDGTEGGRQMFDKNTLRAMHRDLFKVAVQHYRHDVLHISASSKEHQGGDQNHQGAPTVSQSSSSRGAVTVYARIRPLFSKDEQVGDFDVATVIPTNGGQVASKMLLHNCLFEADLKTPYINHLQFEFDHVFGPAASNRHVYDVTAVDVVQGACGGGVGTIFMFGQTGSGKTHTMTAIEEMAAQDIFAALPQSEIGVEEEPQVSVQFVEIRGNRCYDLIARDPKSFPELRLREHAGGVYSAEGAVELFPRSPEDLTVVMRTAHSRRATSATSANDVSSRSHAVCIIHLLRSGGQLVLVDCAGTERRKDSMYHTKERQQEGAEINASLHALKECIRHMSTQQKVPSHTYRASALTKILAEAFINAGGKAKLIVICTASPCASDTEHTLTTLRMGMALGGRGAEHEDKELLKDLLREQRGPREIHPKQWNPDQVRAWLSELHNGQFRDALEALPSNTTGQMLVRLTVTRCAQLCGGSARRGQLLFELLHQEIQRVEESRNARGT